MNNTIFLKDILERGYAVNEEEYNFVKWFYENSINKKSVFLKN